MSQLEDKVVHALRGVLTVREITVLAYLYALNDNGVKLQHKTIAEALQCSSARINAINRRAIRKLQRHSVSTLLTEWLQEVKNSNENV